MDKNTLKKCYVCGARGKWPQWRQIRLPEMKKPSGMHLLTFVCPIHQPESERGINIGPNFNPVLPLVDHAFEITNISMISTGKAIIEIVDPRVDRGGDDEARRSRSRT